MTTIRCYDRFATLKRIAALVGVTTGIAAGLLLALPARAAQAEAQVHKLPTVVISGKSTRTVAAAEVRSLPTVVVNGRRAIDGQQVAAR